MARIAVAATAPFGADVLERLAAQHEVAALLTRPDAPRGRGRRVAPPAGEGRRRAARHPGAAARAARARPRPRRARPSSSAPTASSFPRSCSRSGSGSTSIRRSCPRWRGAAPVERAILAGDAETGVTIHETVKELDAGPIAAQERSRSARTTMPARCSSALRTSRRGCSTPCSPTRDRAFVPQACRRRHLRRQDRACRPPARPRPSGRRARAPGPRALAAHRRARRAARPAGDRLAGASGGRPARSSRSRCSRTAAGGWTPPPGCAAFADGAAISPARAAAFDVIRRVFEDEAYADRALRDGVGRPRRPRRGRSPGSSPTAPCSGPARSTTRSRRSAAGRSGASTRPCAPRCGSAPTSSCSSTGVPRYAAVNESVELVRRARLERAVPFTNAVLRRLADDGRACRRGAAGRDLGGGRARALLSRLGRRDVVARSRRRRRAGADAGPERGARDGRPARARRDRGRAGSRRPGRLARRARRRERARRRAGLAAERRLAARRPRGRLGAGRAGARPLRGARRQGDDARRARSSPSRSNEARARELEENVAPARRDERPGRPRRRARASRPS